MYLSYAKNSDLITVRCVTDTSQPTRLRCQPMNGSKRKQKYTRKQHVHRSSYRGLEYPRDRLILCNRSACANIADYQEVNEQGREDFACAAHTSSERHTSVLPKASPVANRNGTEQLPEPEPKGAFLTRRTYRGQASTSRNGARTAWRPTNIVSNVTHVTDRCDKGSGPRRRLVV